ncbi:MAG: hypothetical protein QW057_00400 [Candidatus Bathyarchaeia archaeon]
MELIEAARKVLRRNYHPARHKVGAAMRRGSGRVYKGINVEAYGYGPCVEPAALGTAFINGKPEIISVVAVCKRGDEYPFLPPAAAAANS